MFSTAVNDSVGEWYLGVYCRKCRAPVPVFQDRGGGVAVTGGSGKLTVACPRCGKKAAYAASEVISFLVYADRVLTAEQAPVNDDHPIAHTPPPAEPEALPVLELQPDPTLDLAPDDLEESDSDPVLELEPDAAPELVPDAALGPQSEPESQPEPVLELATEPTSEQQTEPVADAETPRAAATETTPVEVTAAVTPAVKTEVPPAAEVSAESAADVPSEAAVELTPVADAEPITVAELQPVPERAEPIVDAAADAGATTTVAPAVDTVEPETVEPDSAFELTSMLGDDLVPAIAEATASEAPVDAAPVDEAPPLDLVPQDAGEPEPVAEAKAEPLAVADPVAAPPISDAAEAVAEAATEPDRDIEPEAVEMDLAFELTALLEDEPPSDMSESDEAISGEAPVLDRTPDAPAEPEPAVAAKIEPVEVDLAFDLAAMFADIAEAPPSETIVGEAATVDPASSEPSVDDLQAAEPLAVEPPPLVETPPLAPEPAQPAPPPVSEAAPVVDAAPPSISEAAPTAAAALVAAPIAPAPVRPAAEPKPIARVYRERWAIAANRPRVIAELRPILHALNTRAEATGDDVLARVAALFLDYLDVPAERQSAAAVEQYINAVFALATRGPIGRVDPIGEAMAASLRAVNRHAGLYIAA